MVPLRPVCPMAPAEGDIYQTAAGKIFVATHDLLGGGTHVGMVQAHLWSP